ncbi:MAG: hypothetical protein HY319_15230 [Armatimonadetes bacterium]|nr:hypothetical protein [Armatimonadota bacterium]
MQIVEFCPLPGAVADLPGSLKGIPDRLKGEMKHLFNLLVKDGYVRLKPTVKELHISLEPGRLPALKRFLETGELPPGRVGEALRGDHDPELSARP